MSPALSLGVSFAAAAAAWHAGALTRAGAGAAAAVGAAVLWGSGWNGALVLAAFFVPSTVVGRLAAGRPTVSDARGERRDPVQVLANGAAAAIGALLDRSVPGLGFWIITAALSAAAADTWATSVGAWSRTDPRHLITRRRVPPGTSGGVSLAGTLGGTVGAAIVAATAWYATGDHRLLLGGISIGFGGMLLDSLLGASVQGRFRCPRCGAESERRQHRCGTLTRPIRGLPWLDNDGVNLFTTLAAAAAGAAAWWSLR
jgi:uncharacterized protein (TIGR00297 family)